MDIISLREVFAAAQNVEYTAHCQKRMMERSISRNNIKNCVMNGEIIEDYPLDVDNKSVKSFPSCLILGLKLNNKTVIHVVVGFNGDCVIVISAYYPDLEHWESDYRTRKRRE